MTSSLVGSEMCIRDRRLCARLELSVSCSSCAMARASSSSACTALFNRSCSRYKDQRRQSHPHCEKCRSHLSQ
eukprot:3223009-Prorocentrum_lima.AAC.1